MLGKIFKKTAMDWEQVYQDMTHQDIKMSFLFNQEFLLAKQASKATVLDHYFALANTIRYRIVERWIRTQEKYYQDNVKRVYYLSMEFLIGRLMGNYMVNIGLDQEVQLAMEDLGLDLEEVRDQEMDAGLGNGGLGRLAACFLDSMATLGVPAHGYGIRYDYGIFNQRIENGFQVETPDEWLRHGNPWEISRPEYSVKIKFYGRTHTVVEDDGSLAVRWVDTEDVIAVPYDIPIPGYKNDVVNSLRLWSARSTEQFDLEYFNDGDYEKAVYQKIFTENISKVLYPNDEKTQGRELRLKQEYFFTASSISDIIRRHLVNDQDLKNLHEKVTIQLNDTHPALGVSELMRVLVDEYNMNWEDAWGITGKTFAYTNHTLMPEALECWSVDLFNRLLPRHYQIICEINKRFLREVSDRFPTDDARIRRMSIITDGENPQIRMAHLAVVGSFSVNGVSALHSDLVKKQLFHDFDDFYPGRFNNKTNGITQRRWLLKSNTRLSGLITERIGDEWTTELSKLQGLTKFKNDAGFIEQWKAIKSANKQDLAQYILKHQGLVVDPHGMFDVQVKRIHEYKRQTLFALYMISQYLTIKNDPKAFVQPRTFMVGGKAAPGYAMAKLIIKFINSIADVVNKDKTVNHLMKVVFLENYRVSLAEKVFPASDLSEQISTASTEASGTGNMKFMLNGALTIGTLDGANVEMAEELNNENIFIFGLKTDEVHALQKQGYNPMDYVGRSPMLQEIIQLIQNNFFSPDQPGLFEPLVRSLLDKDPYLVTADFESYTQMQDKVSQAYQDRKAWTQMSIMNVAKSGKFSSDRTIREYAKHIWNVPCM